MNPYAINRYTYLFMDMEYTQYRVDSIYTYEHTYSDMLKYTARFARCRLSLSRRIRVEIAEHAGDRTRRGICQLSDMYMLIWYIYTYSMYVYTFI